MKRYDSGIGTELLFLLRQQRYLYHQLEMLTDGQRQLVETNSPESLLGFISGRRKLIEKLQELDNKLQPVRTNLQKVCDRIEPECKIRVHEIANQVQQIKERILAVTPSELVQSLPLCRDWNFGELFAEAQV